MAQIKGKLKRPFIWQTMTLHQLQVFEATARLGSFTRAAEELHLTQPTVSMQVKHLAKAIGAPLFEQIGKRLYLTESGQVLFKTCQEVFERLDRLEINLFELKGVAQGRLRLSATTTAKYFLPKLLTPFCQQFSGINVSLEVGSHDTVLDRLNDNLDDIYIFSRLPKRDDIEIKAFLCNPLVVVAPTEHPLMHKPQVTLTDLAEYPFVMRERGSATREAADHLLRQQGIPVRVKLELGSNEAIKQAVSQGLGLSILSLHSLTDRDSELQLSVLNVDHFPIHQQWYTVFPKGKILSTVARTFVDYLLAESSQYCQVHPISIAQTTHIANLESNQQKMEASLVS